MKNVLKSSKTYMLAGLLIIAVTASAWQFKSKQKQHTDTTANNTADADTTKRGQHNTEKDEPGVKNLEGLNDINIDLKGLDINLSGLDTTIERTVRQALANIDFEKISRETQEALNKVDWPQIKIDIDRSIQEAEKQVKNIDLSEVKEKLKEVQEKLNSKEFKEQFDGRKLQEIIDDAMSKANESIENAMGEVKEYKEFTRSLEQDGLIDKKKGYKIEWKDDGSLFINNHEQPKEIADKYRKYYRKGGYTIKIDGDNTESL